MTSILEQRKLFCDVCWGLDGWRNMTLQRCKSCGVSIHNECYGIEGNELKKRNPDFQCWACAAVGTTIKVRERDADNNHVGYNVVERPTECMLCGVDDGYDWIHAMHPIYDDWGLKGRQILLPAVKNKPKRLGWGHTLCCNTICHSERTAGCVYGCRRNGDWGGNIGRFYKGDDDSINSALFDDDDDYEAIHHFVIILPQNKRKPEREWAKTIKEHRSIVKCGLCGKSDEVSTSFRIPLQCCANDPTEFKEFKGCHKELGDLTCTLGFHAGCAMWHKNVAGEYPNARRLFFFPGSSNVNDEYSSPVTNLFCLAHAQDLPPNKPAKNLRYPIDQIEQLSTSHKSLSPSPVRRLGTENSTARSQKTIDSREKEGGNRSSSHDFGTAKANVASLSQQNNNNETNMITLDDRKEKRRRRIEKNISMIRKDLNEKLYPLGKDPIIMQSSDYDECVRRVFLHWKERIPADSETFTSWFNDALIRARKDLLVSFKRVPNVVEPDGKIRNNSKKRLHKLTASTDDNPRENAPTLDIVASGMNEEDSLNKKHKKNPSTEEESIVVGSELVNDNVDIMMEDGGRGGLPVARRKSDSTKPIKGKNDEGGKSAIDRREIRTNSIDIVDDSSESSSVFLDLDDRKEQYCKKLVVEILAKEQLESRKINKRKHHSSTSRSDHNVKVEPNDDVKVEPNDDGSKLDPLDNIIKETTTEWTTRLQEKFSMGEVEELWEQVIKRVYLALNYSTTPTDWSFLTQVPPTDVGSNPKCKKYLEHWDTFDEKKPDAVADDITSCDV